MGEAVNAAPENIENNMVALFFAELVGLVAAVITWLGQRERRISQGVGIGVAVAIFVGGVIWFFADRDSFSDIAHYGAAIPLFLFIIVVVFLNSRRRWKWRYLTIAILMVVSGLVIGAIIIFDDWAHGVLVLEAALIVLFGVFWGIQTVERWKALPPAE
jgi:peptidoglycan/LPS O-acetylase OafA/YrhL